MQLGLRSFKLKKLKNIVTDIWQTKTNTNFKFQGSAMNSC